VITHGLDQWLEFCEDELSLSLRFSLERETDKIPACNPSTVANWQEYFGKTFKVCMPF
jgi:hypothetical protein